MNMENKDLERVIYTWFDMKYELYNKLNHDDSIYLYYDGEKYADIRILKISKYIYYKWEFWEEFSDVFPIQRFQFEWIITKWVEDTFNLKGFAPKYQVFVTLTGLEIPLI